MCVFPSFQSLQFEPKSMIWPPSSPEFCLEKNLGCPRPPWGPFQPPQIRRFTERLGGPELGCGPGGPEPDGKRPTPLGWMVGSDEFPQLGFPIFTGRTFKLRRGGYLGGEALYLKKMVCWAVIFWKINGEQAVPTWAESACSEYQVISA